jgi:hypothetical protein
MAINDECFLNMNSEWKDEQDVRSLDLDDATSKTQVESKTLSMKALTDCQSAFQAILKTKPRH